LAIWSWIAGIGCAGLALRSGFVDSATTADTDSFHWIGNHAGWFVTATSADWIAPVARRATTMRRNVIPLPLPKLRNSARMFGVGARFGLAMWAMHDLV
jgi:hypothetical protein